MFIIRFVHDPSRACPAMWRMSVPWRMSLIAVLVCAGTAAGSVYIQPVAAAVDAVPVDSALYGHWLMLASGFQQPPEAQSEVSGMNITRSGEVYSLGADFRSGTLERRGTFISKKFLSADSGLFTMRVNIQWGYETRGRYALDGDTMTLAHDDGYTEVYLRSDAGKAVVNPVRYALDDSADFGFSCSQICGRPALQGSYMENHLSLRGFRETSGYTTDLFVAELDGISGTGTFVVTGFDWNINTILVSSDQACYQFTWAAGPGDTAVVKIDTLDLVAGRCAGSIRFTAHAVNFNDTLNGFFHFSVPLRACGAFPIRTFIVQNATAVSDSAVSLAIHAHGVPEPGGLHDFVFEFGFDSAFLDFDTLDTGSGKIEMRVTEILRRPGLIRIAGAVRVVSADSLPFFFLRFRTAGVRDTVHTKIRLLSWNFRTDCFLHLGRDGELRIIPKGATGFDNVPASAPPFHFDIHPQPVNDAGIVRVDVPDGVPFRLRLFDAEGREHPAVSNDVRYSTVHAIRFDSSDMRPGMYIIGLEAAGKHLYRKFLVINK